MQNIGTAKSGQLFARSSDVAKQQDMLRRTLAESKMDLCFMPVYDLGTDVCENVTAVINGCYQTSNL